MNEHISHLEWIDTQATEMLRLVTEWSNINSGSRNLEGLAHFTEVVQKEFESLGGEIELRDLPPMESVDSKGNIVQSSVGRALRIVKRPQAALRILLCIHLDTVYGIDHPFQRATRVDAQTLRGPGVADAKGGLVILLTALRALERSELATKVGWEVILNPDEEIASPGSTPLLLEAARRNHVGLLFEPSLPDGSLVGARKGSGNFTVVVRGRAAHSGRDFHQGRSAILALAHLITRFDEAQAGLSDVTINCGKVEGGGAINIVPDLAIGRFNIRVTSVEEQQEIEKRIASISAEIGQQDGISVQVRGKFTSPPKPLDPRSAKLFERVQECGKQIGLKLEVHPSGGACDGNRLSAAGLPVVDTLGPRGGHLHSDQEYILIDSLVERAKLTALILSDLMQNGIAGLESR